MRCPFPSLSRISRNGIAPAVGSARVAVKRSNRTRPIIALAAGIALCTVAGRAQSAFGTIAVSSSTSQTVTVTAQVAGTVSTVEVLTSGNPNLDFTAGASGTCSNVTLAAGQTCTQDVTFKPGFPGMRIGAVVLLDSNKRVLGTAYLNGVGKAGLAVFSPGNIIPVAGSGAWDLIEDGQPATIADLNLPSSEVLDAAGNMYIADSIHNRIRKVDASTNIMTTIAGNGNTGFGGDGGLATAAMLNTPSGVAIDGAGNLYIADTGNNRIRMIAASTGVITTIAGNGTAGYAGDLGAATAAELNQPWGVTLDPAGNLYIADTSNQRIRKVDGTGIITTVAGDGFTNPDGRGAYAGDGGPAIAAELNRPFAVAFDLAGNMYIPDSANNRIRKVDTLGIISTFAGTGIVGDTGDGGPATSAQLWAPSAVIVDTAQNVYISDTQNNAIRKVYASTGKMTTVVQTSIGKYLYQQKLQPMALYGPLGLALDGQGNLYVADYYYMRIREIQANAAVLDFTATPTRQGDTSAPKNQALENDGNDSLSLTAITPDSNSAVGSATTCSSSTALGVGATCDIAAEFAPTVSGNPLLANINITGQTVDSPLDLTLVGDATPVNSTTVVLTSAPNPSNFGQSVTFSANVTTGAGTGALTGTVTFNDGTTKLGTVTLDSSSNAVFSTPSLTVGSHSIKASYSGDKLHFASDSNVVSQVVNEATAVTLTSSANPSAIGAPLTFTATVSIAAGGGVTPDGTVTFMDGGTSIGTATLNASAVATLTVSSLADGLHSITAVYAGDPANYILGSTSAVLKQDVLAASTVVVAGLPNPSIYGSAVKLTATVTSNGSTAPTGTVKFLDGAATLGTGTIVGTSGVATFTTSSLNAGSHAITASYLGDTSDGPGTSAPFVLQVNLTPTTTGIAAAPSPGIAGKPVTLTATVTGNGAAITGTVTFMDGTTALGTVRLAANGTAALPANLAPGPHALIASYSGDSNDEASASSALALAVNLATTSVTLKSSGSPSVVLQPVTFTATVTGNGGVPTGTVTFLIDGKSAGTATLSGTGVVTFTDSSLVVGTHTVTAQYSGDVNDNPSASVAISQVETPIATTTGLGSSTTAGSNPQVVLVATTVGASGPIPTGTVTFNNGATVIGTATLNASGVGTLAPDLPVGNYSIVAVYSGDSLHAPSTSAPISITGSPVGFDVIANPPKVTLATSQNGTVNITLASNSGFADTIGMGCLSVPAAVNCHFSSNTVTLKSGQRATVQLTIDTNAPLSGGTSASNAKTDSRTALAGLCLPFSLLFGCIFWRFRKRNAAMLVGALVLFLAGAFAVTGCGGFTQGSAAPGTYTLQVGGVGTGTNVSHYTNITLVITK